MNFVNGQSVGRIRELEEETTRLRKELELARSSSGAGNFNAQQVLDGASTHHNRKVSFAN